MSENFNIRSENPMLSSFREILPMLISGHDFDDDQKNLALNVFCGISPESIFMGKMLKDILAPRQQTEKEDVVPVVPPEYRICVDPKTQVYEERPYVSVPLLFNLTVYGGANNLLIADEKAGKSKLAGEIARHESIHHPLFILREDYSERDVNLLYRIVGEKAIIVSLKRWHMHEDQIQRDKLKDAGREIYFQFISPEYRKLQSITQQVYSRARVNKRVQNEEIAIFQSLVEILIEQENVDFVVLDSLNSLLSGITHISRTLIESILKPMMERHITFLLIHHKNSKGSVYGSKAVSQAFDHIYHLQKTPSYKSIVNEELILEEQSRSTAPVRVKFLRKWDENGVPSYTVLAKDDDCGGEIFSDKPLNVKDRIIAALKHYGKNPIPFEYVKEQLVGVTSGAIKNGLKDLENEKLVQKADGKNWTQVTFKN